MSKNGSNDKWLIIFAEFVSKGDMVAEKALLGKLRGIADYLQHATMSNLPKRDWENIIIWTLENLWITYKDKIDELLERENMNFAGLMYVTMRRLLLQHLNDIHGLGGDELNEIASALPSPDEYVIYGEKIEALHECLKSLREANELHWLTFLIWAEIAISYIDITLLDISDIFPDPESGGTETNKIKSILINSIDKLSEFLKLNPNTYNRITPKLNENTIKSHIRRAKDYLFLCLEKKEVFA